MRNEDMHFKKSEGITLLLRAIVHMAFGKMGEKVWLFLLDSSTAGFPNTVGCEWGKYLPAT